LVIYATSTVEEISSAVSTSLEKVKQENTDQSTDIQNRRAAIDVAFNAQSTSNREGESTSLELIENETSRAQQIEEEISIAINEESVNAQASFSAMDIQEEDGEIAALSTAWYDKTSSRAQEAVTYKNNVDANDESVSTAQSTAKYDVDTEIARIRLLVEDEESRAEDKEQRMSAALWLVSDSRTEDYKNQSNAIREEGSTCTYELSIATVNLESIITGDSKAGAIGNLQSLLSLFTQSEVNMLNKIEESNTEMYQVVRTMNEAYGNVYWYEPDNQVLRYSAGDSRIVNGDDIVYVRHQRVSYDFDGTTNQFKTTSGSQINNLKVAGVERKIIDEPAATEPEAILKALPMSIDASVNGSPGM